MVRTLDGNARAFLSDRYRPLDHDEILERVLPALGEFDLDWSESSLEVTDQRLYMKLVNPRVQSDINPGDTVQAGVLVTNSEIGMGSFSVSPTGVPPGVPERHDPTGLRQAEVPHRCPPWRRGRDVRVLPRRHRPRAQRGDCARDARPDSRRTHRRGLWQDRRQPA